MRTALRTLTTALAATALLACGGDDDGPTGTGSFTGTYTLRTIQNTSLPYTLALVPGYKLEIIAGSVTINADNTYSDRVTFRATAGTAVTTDEIVDVGTYVRSGNTFQFTDSEGATASGTLSGRTLTIVAEGLTAVFRR